MTDEVVIREKRFGRKKREIIKMIKQTPHPSVFAAHLPLKGKAIANLFTGGR